MEHQAPRFNRLSRRCGVNGIADERRAFVLHVNADLVGAPGVKVASNERSLGGSICPEHGVVGDGSTACGRGDDGHFLAIPAIAPDVSEDGFLHRRGNALGDAEVDFFVRAIGKLRREVLVRLVMLGDDQTTGGVFIETMHNARAFHSADARQAALAMVKQGVDQCAIGISCGGMNHHAGFFIEHDEVIVFKKNLQRNLLRSCDVRHRLGEIDRDDVTDFYGIARFRRLAIAEDVLFADEILDARARQGGKARSNPSIEPFMVGNIDSELQRRK